MNSMIRRTAEVLFPDLLFGLDIKEHQVLLTFDDGPHPASTLFILSLLEEYRARAIFFCLGKNAEQYPTLFSRITEKGHLIGNHSYSHLNGWKTGTTRYCENVEKGQKILGSTLFRPPYGKLTPMQYFILRRKYRIALWTHLVRDYDLGMQPRHELKRLLNKVKPGAIMTFHDSEKAVKNLQQFLPSALKAITDKGFQFALPEQINQSQL